MGVLMVPGFDEEPFPTLGPQVAEWLEEFLVFGPGDVRGRPYRLDEEKLGVLYRLYEVYPQGHPKAGRRRYKRGGLSVRKGWAKTEFGAAIAAAELHPDAPVRCDGFDAWGDPVGIGVADPYIPMVAYTEEQSEELAYGALLVMLGEGPLADDFDLGVERIVVKGHDGRAAGKAVALAAAPDSRDGARTTFQLFDETHRQHSPRLLHAHETMLANVPKRKAADAWTLEVTTAYEPGRGSVAEKTHSYARLVDEGKVDDRLLFFYHREAGGHHDLDTSDGMRAAVLEASGPAAEFTDVDYIVSLGSDPQVDRRYWERVWLNRVVSSSAQFFPVDRFDELALPPSSDGSLWLPEDGALVTLGFDGARTRDATGLVVTDVESGRQAVVGMWERPDPAPEDWQVDGDAVDQAVADAFRRWDVASMYADPYWWESYVAEWRGRYRKRAGRWRVHEWHTNRMRPMAFALRAYRGAMVAGEALNNGDPRLRAHLANARRHEVNVYDDEGKPLAVIRKERPDSPHKIDLSMCGCLSWEARRDAVKAGVRKRSRVPRSY